MELQWTLARGHELYIVGQQYRQLILWNGDGAAVLAVDNRDRRPPITLAADQPVAQAVVHRVMASAVLVQPRCHAGNGLVGWRAVKSAAVHHHAVMRVSLGHRG